MNQVITMIDLEITPPLQRETVRSYVYRMFMIILCHSICRRDRPCLNRKWQTF